MTMVSQIILSIFAVSKTQAVGRDFMVIALDDAESA